MIFEKTVPDGQTNSPCHNYWKSKDNSVKKIHTDIKGKGGIERRKYIK